MESPSPSATTRAIVESVCTASEQDLREFLSQRPRLVTRYWGGGVRVKRLPLRRLVDGLVRAVEGGAAGIPEYVDGLWRAGHAPLVSAVETAFNRWPAANGPGFTTEALNWLASRYQPDVTELVWATSKVVGAIPELSDVAIVRSDTEPWPRALAAPTQTLQRMRENLSGTALELIGFFLDGHEALAPEIVAALKEADLGRAAERIEALHPRTGRHLAALLHFTTGDRERALALASQMEDDVLGCLRRIGLEALSHLAGGDAGRCLKVLATALSALPPDLPDLLRWPTWQLIRGLAEIECGRPIAAAREFLCNGAPGREYALLPVQLAAEALKMAGCEPVRDLETLLGRGWAGEADRKRAAAALAAVEAETRRTPAGAGRPSPPSPPTPSSGGADEPVTAPRPEGQNKPARLQSERLGPELSELGARFSDYLDGLARLAAAPLKGKPTALASVQTLWDGLEVADAAVREQLGRAAADLPVLSDSIQTREAADEYLDALGGALASATRRAREEVTRRKESLRQRFASLDLPPPEELGAADSEEALKLIAGRYEPRLRFEAAYRGLLSGEEAPPDWAAISPPERLNGYCRLADEGHSPAQADRILKLLRNDPAACTAGAGDAWKLVRDSMALLLEAGRPLPAGAWDLLFRSSAVPANQVLASSGLLPLIEDKQAEAIDAAGLGEAIQCEPEELPPQAERMVVIARAQQVEPSERVRVIARLLRRFPTERSVAKALLEALLAAGQDSHALLLACIGAQLGWLDETDHPTLKDSILCVALNAAHRESAASEEETNEGALEDLLGSPEWLLQAEEDVVALLYLHSLQRFPGEYYDFRFRWASAFEGAKRTYPAIVERLVRHIESSDEQRAEWAATADLLLSEMQPVLDEFDAECRKRTCYNGWPSAENYQSWFRKYLGAYRQQALRRGAWSSPSADELVARAAQDGRLVEAEGHGLRAMRRFLGKQLERLHAIHDAIESLPPHIGFEEASALVQTIPASELTALRKVTRGRPPFDEICAALAGRTP